MRKKNYSLFIKAGILIFSVFFSISSLVAKNLKPRVLVIPFDNVLVNKDAEWMKESIAENLKEELITTSRFDVMDVQLLRMINPDIHFADLTQKEATPMAQKLNCEAAIIGRFIAKDKNGLMTALIQIEAVNTITGETIVIESQNTDIDGSIFSKIKMLSEKIANEFVKKLPAIDAKKNTRSSHLEKIIYRLEHPPKGFFDTLAFSVPGLDEKQIKKIKFKPDFDIDTFTYDLYLPEGSKQLEFKYDIWGKNFTPSVNIAAESCTPKNCEIKNDESEMLISRTNDKKNPNDAKKTENSEYSYKIRIHRQPPPGPILGRMWINAGYPYMKSLSLINPEGNPGTMTSGGLIPFDQMSGILSLEAGFAPGRWQLPAGLNWALVTHFQYAKGELPFDNSGTVYKAEINLFSMGAGLRIDRPFMLSKVYGISPMIGIYTHYQIFSHAASGSSFYLIGLNPELGLVQYIQLGSSKYRISISTIVGSYIYKAQNLSYFKASGGIEYAFK